MGFAGQTVYITGASAGIGKELARQLAARGAKLALFARRKELLESLADEARGLGAPKVQAYACDVTDRDSVRQAFAAAAEAVAPCDILIANAGVGYPIRARKFDADAAAGIYKVNVFGLLNSIEAVLPSMLTHRQGQIVGISSLASYRSFPESHAYCASKSAVSAQLEGLRLELASRGIRVTNICPGFIRTDMTAQNTIPMPFLMDCDVAVRRIVSAIERKARVYNFPKRLYWSIKLSRLVPEAVWERVMRLRSGKSYKATPC